MRRDLKTIPLEELWALADNEEFFAEATSEQLGIILERLAVERRRQNRRPPLRLRSGRFGERLRRRRARTQNDDRVRFEQPWQRSLEPPPHGRKPFPRRASLDELHSGLGVGSPECDLLIKEIIAQKMRPRTALVPARLRRRGKLTVEGKRLRIDDPLGRMNAWRSAREGRNYGKYLDGDHRKITLTNAQINRVLNANGLPIPMLDESERDALLPSHRDLPDTAVARLFASAEIDKLTWRLHEARSLPNAPSAR
jgi:hypothetical protein